MISKQLLTPQQALEKIKFFCAYQERSHKEVTEKLYAYGLSRKDVEHISVELIEENFLNEERFAVAFAGGKFRVKHWGRQKIKYELKQRGVSSFCVNLALKEIEETDYLSTLNNLATKKWESLIKEQFYSRQAKTSAYLVTKGFEQHLIIEVIERLKKENNE